MDFFGFTKKISKCYVRKKSDESVEFEETAFFTHNDYEKVFGDAEKINKQSKIVLFFTAGLIAILLIQTFKLQIIDRNKFSVMAENNRQKEVTFRANRGIVYDRNNNILVRNEAIFDLVGIGKDLPENKIELGEMASKISLLVGKNKQEIEEAIVKLDRFSYRPELIAENIGTAAAIEIETEKEKLRGVEARRNAIRSYVDAKYFSQIIGYTGRVSSNELLLSSDYEPADFIGKAGLESFYESDLRGKKGVEKMEIDAGGKIIATLSKIDAESGNNLVLSIDGDLQKKLQDLLEFHAQKAQQRNNYQGGAAAIALDPRNGKILALASLPTYDNNKFVNPSSKAEREAILNNTNSPLLNRVIGGRYPPGSTIKPIMGIVALAEGIIDKNTIIEDKGVISVPEYNGVRNFFGWNRSGLGPVNVISAIAKSSDIFFYTVGGGFGKFTGLGVDKIAEYLEKFNLGKKLGIDLPGETEGVVPTKAWKLARTDGKYPWTIGDTYNLSIGQGYLLTTPLQVASWTEVVANGGVLYKPRLVDKITSGDNNEVIKEIPTVIITDKIADKKYIEISRQGMREAVLGGSAAALRDLPFAAAGKTGTAEFINKGKELTHSWFTSFAPYDNPEIVLTVLIEGGGEGSTTAVPIAKEILSWYFGEK